MVAVKRLHITMEGSGSSNLTSCFLYRSWSGFLSKFGLSRDRYLPSNVMGGFGGGKGDVLYAEQVRVKDVHAEMCLFLAYRNVYALEKCVCVYANLRAFDIQRARV